LEEDVGRADELSEGLAIGIEIQVELDRSLPTREVPVEGRQIGKSGTSDPQNVGAVCGQCATC
jgi:hypothetical protein